MTTCIDYTVLDDLAGLAADDRLGPPLSRRLFLAGTAAFSLAACGGNSSTTETPSAGSAGFPVTLRGKEGTVTIPAQPQRVIAVGYQRDTDTALALGVTPIAITENSLYPSLMAPWWRRSWGVRSRNC